MIRRLALALAIAAAVAFPGGAAAGWSLLKSGPSVAKAKTLGAGNVPTASKGTGHKVNLSWAASSYVGGGSPQGYVITRYDATTGAFAAAGSGTCAGTVAALSCTDNAVNGTWQYTITPATANWRGAESAKSAAVAA